MGQGWRRSKLPLSARNVSEVEMRRQGKPPRKPGKPPPGEGWWVYLLRCIDGSLYTGIAKDVARRCEQHNAGTASRYTRSRRPVALVCQEAYPSRSLALKREAAIKAMSKQQKESLIRLAG